MSRYCMTCSPSVKITNNIDLSFKKLDRNLNISVIVKADIKCAGHCGDLVDRRSVSRCVSKSKTMDIPIKFNLRDIYCEWQCDKHLKCFERLEKCIIANSNSDRPVDCVEKTLEDAPYDCKSFKESLEGTADWDFLAKKFLDELLMDKVTALGVCKCEETTRSTLAHDLRGHIQNSLDERAKRRISGGGQ